MLYDKFMRVNTRLIILINLLIEFSALLSDNGFRFTHEQSVKND